MSVSQDVLVKMSKKKSRLLHSTSEYISNALPVVDQCYLNSPFDLDSRNLIRKEACDRKVPSSNSSTGWEKLVRVKTQSIPLCKQIQGNCGSTAAPGGASQQPAAWDCGSTWDRPGEYSCPFQVWGHFSQFECLITHTAWLAQIKWNMRNGNVCSSAVANKKVGKLRQDQIMIIRKTTSILNISGNLHRCFQWCWLIRAVLKLMLGGAILGPRWCQLWPRSTP